MLATAGLAVVAFALFLRRCLRHPDPIVPLSMFRERTVVICSALGFVVGCAVFGMVGYLPGLMQAAFGLPATVAGTVILPLVLGILSASIWSGRRTARTGRYRRVPGRRVRHRRRRAGRPRARPDVDPAGPRRRLRRPGRRGRRGPSAR